MSYDTDGFKISSCGQDFIIRKGVTPGRIWIGTETGEGGDFNQDELFMLIRDFYQEKF